MMEDKTIFGGLDLENGVDREGFFVWGSETFAQYARRKDVKKSLMDFMYDVAPLFLASPAVTADRMIPYTEAQIKDIRKKVTASQDTSIKDLLSNIMFTGEGPFYHGLSGEREKLTKAFCKKVKEMATAPLSGKDDEGPEHMDLAGRPKSPDGSVLPSRSPASSITAQFKDLVESFTEDVLDNEECDELEAFHGHVLKFLQDADKLRENCRFDEEEEQVMRDVVEKFTRKVYDLTCPSHATFSKGGFDMDQTQRILESFRDQGYDMFAKTVFPKQTVAPFTRPNSKQVKLLVPYVAGAFDRILDHMRSKGSSATINIVGGSAVRYPCPLETQEDVFKFVDEWKSQMHRCVDSRSLYVKFSTIYGEMARNFNLLNTAQCAPIEHLLRYYVTRVCVLAGKVAKTLFMEPEEVKEFGQKIRDTWQTTTAADIHSKLFPESLTEDGKIVIIGSDQVDDFIQHFLFYMQQHLEYTHKFVFQAKGLCRRVKAQDKRAPSTATIGSSNSSGLKKARIDPEPDDASRKRLGESTSGEHVPAPRRKGGPKVAGPDPRAAIPVSSGEADEGEYGPTSREMGYSTTYVPDFLAAAHLTTREKILFGRAVMRGFLRERNPRAEDPFESDGQTEATVKAAIARIPGESD